MGTSRTPSNRRRPASQFQGPVEVDSNASVVEGQKNHTMQYPWHHRAQAHRATVARLPPDRREQL